MRWRRVLVAASLLALAGANVGWAVLASAYARLADTVLAADRHPGVVVVERHRDSVPAALPALASPPQPRAVRALAPLDWGRFGVMRLSSSAFVVDRALVDELLEDSKDLRSIVRVVPATANGRSVGMRLFGVGPDTLAGALGFENGDCLVSINGLPMAAPDQVLQAYAVLRTASVLDVRLRRRGKEMETRYYVE